MSTTHNRQPPQGSRPSKLQSVGTSAPALRQASRRYASSSTVTFAVNEETPTTDYTITLSRRPEVSSGTAYLDQPADWNTIKQGIHHLGFMVYQVDENDIITTIARQHKLALAGCQRQCDEFGQETIYPRRVFRLFKLRLSAQKQRSRLKQPGERLSRHFKN